MIFKRQGTVFFYMIELKQQLIQFSEYLLIYNLIYFTYQSISFRIVKYIHTSSLIF